MKMMKMKNVQICRIPVELTPLLEMHLTRLLLEACLTLLLEIIKNLQEALPGHDYVSPLSVPPRRGESDIIDPWSAGRDHPRPRMKLLLLVRPLSLMMWLDPWLCAQGGPTCRFRRRSEIGCCHHLSASSRRALALRRLALRRFIVFRVQLKHVLLMFHLSLSKLFLRRAPATSLVMVGPEHRRMF